MYRRKESTAGLRDIDVDINVPALVDVQREGGREEDGEDGRGASARTAEPAVLVDWRGVSMWLRKWEGGGVLGSLILRVWIGGIVVRVRVDSDVEDWG